MKYSIYCKNDVPSCSLVELIVARKTVEITVWTLGNFIVISFKNYLQCDFFEKMSLICRFYIGIGSRSFSTFSTWFYMSFRFFYVIGIIKTKKNVVLMLNILTLYWLSPLNTGIPKTFEIYSFQFLKCQRGYNLQEFQENQCNRH